MRRLLNSLETGRQLLLSYMIKPFMLMESVSILEFGGLKCSIPLSISHAHTCRGSSMVSFLNAKIRFICNY
jgi:hypothetical protein